MLHHLVAVQLEHLASSVATEREDGRLTPVLLHFGPEVIKLISTYSPLPRNDYMSHLLARELGDGLFLCVLQEEEGNNDGLLEEYN